MSADNLYNDSLEGEGSGEDYFYAISSFEEALAEGVTDSLHLSEDAFIHLIDHYINNDEIKASVAATIAFRSYPFSFDILIRLADILIVTDKANEAITLLGSYEESYGNNEEMKLLYARAYINLGDFEIARKFYNGIRENCGSELNVAETPLALAEECIELNNFGEAVEYLNDVVREWPDSYDCYNDLAYCYEKLNDLSLSVDNYNKYLDYNPFNENVWFNIGTIYAKMTRFDEAMEAFGYSLALDPSHSSSLYNLAVVYLTNGDYRSAVEKFDLFLECEPDGVAGYIGKANALMGEADYEGAREAFRGAMQFEAGVAEASMGIIVIDAVEAYIKGDYEEFFTHIRSVVNGDITWVESIRKMLPQLESDENFKRFLLSIAGKNEI